MSALLVAGAACLFAAAFPAWARAAERFGVKEANFEAGTCNVDTCTYKSVEANPAEAFTQAAGHPPFGITGFEMSSETSGLGKKPIGALKDVRVDIAPGLAANPQALGERCPVAVFEEDGCATKYPRSVAGENKLTVFEAPANVEVTAPVYNLEPEAGLPLEFGIHVGVPSAEAPLVTNEHILLFGHVSWHREPAMEAHGVTTGDFHEYFEINNIPSSTPLLKSKLIFFGNREGSGFLTLPSECSASATSHLRVESYEGEVSETFTHTPVGVSGCDKVPFAPSAGIAPAPTSEGGSSQSDAPDAATVSVRVPQNTEPGQLDSADPREITVTLPAGMTFNPSAAAGLEACTDAQFGILPTRPGERPVVQAAEGGGAGGGAPIDCPPASEIGTFAIETPDLPPGSLTGHVYVGEPLGPDLRPGDGSSESGEQYRVFLDAASARYGVDVRLVGNVVANATTGRLQTTVSAPQLPFSESFLRLRGGARAPLANPLECGAAHTEGAFAPYGQAVGGATMPAAASSLSAFTVTGCASPLPFSLTQAMTASPDLAGTASMFTLSLARADGQQYVAGMQATLPEGVLGSIASVPALCPEALANAGACPAASQIGTVRTSAGSGPEPLSLPGSGEPPGAVFLTGPYAGGPYGLSVVLPAEHVGPYDYGRVVARAKIDIDPYTARVTTTAVKAYVIAPDGQATESATAVPTVVGGAAVRLRTLTIALDRPGFMVNPTSCADLPGESVLAGVARLGEPVSATDLVSSPFQVSGCAALAFAPHLAATTSARTSRLGGASLEVSLTRGAREANIREVAVTLPAQIVSRITTLQKACPEATANAGILSCPRLSHVGTATLTTPLLPGTLQGPAILVSHGGAAFPDLDFVLQGDGITLIEVSHTNIHDGVTSSTFPALPDAPFSSFHAVFPTGSDSLLSANGSFCARASVRAVRQHKRPSRAHARSRRKHANARSAPRRALAARRRRHHHHVRARARPRGRRPARTHALVSGLVMPTTIVGYNGATVKRDTAVTVSGCGSSRVKAAKLVVPRVRVRGRKAFLTVIVPGPGTLRARGPGLRPATEHARRAGRVTITVALARAGARELRHRRLLTSSVRLTFARVGSRAHLFARAVVRFRAAR